jgi:general secretion pathway protein N
VKVLLSFAVMALGGLLVLQWRDWPPEPPNAADAGVHAADETPIPDLNEAPVASELLPPPPAIEDYASVTDRPLFLPDRRPPPEEPTQEEPTQPEELTELDGVDLTAVIITPSTVSAWVRRPGQRETVRLRIGDDFDGWTVKTIEPQQLELERQGETDQLVLRDYANAPAVTPPTPIRQRRPRRGAETPAQPPSDKPGSARPRPTRQRQQSSQQPPRPAARRPQEK